MEETPRPRPAAAVTRKPKPRLSVPLTDEGGIDLENMQPENREKLERALGSSRLPAPAAASSDKLDPDLVKVVFATLGNVLASAVARGGAPAAVAKAMALSDEELTSLAGPTARLLDKYLPGAMSRFGEEFAWSLAVASVVMPRYALLQELRAKPTEKAAPSQGIPMVAEPHESQAAA